MKHVSWRLGRHSLLVLLFAVLGTAPAVAALGQAPQATSAALVRARTEIERLTDMVVEAKLEAAAAPDTSDRGRVQALRATHGLA